MKKYHHRCRNDTKKNLDLLLETTPKFRTLKELTDDTRATIAIQAYFAQINKKYGAITALAKEHKISRQFIYNLLYMLQISLIISFSVSEEAIAKTKRKSIEWILSLRFEGRCSISSISTVMKRMNLPYSSEGFISQTLKDIGGLLPHAQKIELSENLHIHTVEDEIFSKGKPILITEEPKSTFILGINLEEDRKAETWLKQFNDIEETNPKLKIEGATTDNGKGLCSAIEKKFPFIDRQPDTYHGVAHVFGEVKSRFAKKVKMATEKEEKKDKVCMNRKTDEAFETRYELYEEASKETIKAVEKYEDFTYLYFCVINELKPFYSNGEIRDREKAKEVIEVALDLMEELYDDINDEIKSVRDVLPNLLNYFEQSKKSVEVCRNFGISEENRKVLSLAWQWNKAVIKAKKTTRKKRAKEERDFYLEYAKDSLGDDFERMKEAVFDELNNIIQSSSMIENLNSILRPYLNNSKNHVSQEFLNTFAFYHNHRRYKDGERKGKTPMELLTGKKQEGDWIELLLDVVEKEKPDFFL